MGFGGGSSPYIPPPPVVEKPQVSKSVSEAATAARQAQRDKAARAQGIRGSVLTSPLAGQSGQSGSGNTLLGQ